MMDGTGRGMLFDDDGNLDVNNFGRNATTWIDGMKLIEGLGLFVKSRWVGIVITEWRPQEVLYAGRFRVEMSPSKQNWFSYWSYGY